MNEPGVSGALGVPFRFRELESAFGGCITLGSIEIWDSAFCCLCCFSRYGSLFPSLYFLVLFLMACVTLACSGQLLAVLVLLSFLYCMGTRALFLSHSFFFLSLGRICISGHCKLVFLLWSGHGGASTARLKFCLTILRFHRHLHTLVLFLLCLFCVCLSIPLPLSHFWSYQSLDQFLQRPSQSFAGFLGLGLSFQPFFLFDRDSPLHPNCFI